MTDQSVLDPSAAPASQEPTAVAKPSFVRVLIFGIAAGLIASVLSWQGGEAIRDVFKPAFIKPVSDFSNENDLAKLAATAKEARFAFLILAGTMGLVFGLAGGLARGSTKSAVGAGVVGLLLGVSASLGCSALLMPIARAYAAEMATDMAYAIAIIGGLWAPLGLIAGLAFGLGLGHGLRGPILQGATGGLVGALIGTATYLLAGAILFPLAESSTPLPLATHARGLARLAVALPAALLASTSAWRGWVAFKSSTK